MAFVVVTVTAPMASAQVDVKPDPTNQQMWDALTPNQKEQLRQYVRWGGTYVPPPGPLWVDAPAGYQAAHRAYMHEQNMLMQNAVNDTQRLQFQQHHTKTFELRQKAKVITRFGASAIVRTLPAVGSMLLAWEAYGLVSRWVGFGGEMTQAPPQVSSVRMFTIEAGQCTTLWSPGVLCPPASPAVGFALTTRYVGFTNNPVQHWYPECPQGHPQQSFNVKRPNVPVNPYTATPTTTFAPLVYQDAALCGGMVESRWSPTPGHVLTPPLPTKPAQDYPDNPGSEQWMNGTPLHQQPGGATPPSDEDVDAAIEEHLQDYPTEREFFAEMLDPDAPPGEFHYPDSMSGVVTMPSCIGMSYNACVTALQEAGFGVITRETRTFAEAVPMPQGAPDQVLSQLPLPNGLVDPALVTVTLDTNPAEAEMPRLVPAPGARELPEEYEASLTELGLVLEPEYIVNDSTTADPERGPNEVTGTAPAPGSRVPSGEPVTVRVNPPDWPVPGGGGGSCEPWLSPSINFSPLQGLGVVSVFPFGAPFWVFEALDAWVGEPQTPAHTFYFPYGPEDGFDVDLAMFDPYMPQVRAVLLVGSMIAAAWFFLSLAMGAPSNRQQGAD